MDSTVITELRVAAEDVEVRRRYVLPASFARVSFWIVFVSIMYLAYFCNLECVYVYKIKICEEMLAAVSA